MKPSRALTRSLSLAGTLAFTLACAGVGGPAFEASNGQIEDKGVAFFSNATTVSCAVKNLGDSPAPATVSYTLTLADGTKVQADEYVMLNPKETKPVLHEFKQLRVPDPSKAKVDCAAAPAK